MKTPSRVPAPGAKRYAVKRPAHEILVEAHTNIAPAVGWLVHLITTKRGLTQRRIIEIQNAFCEASRLLGEILQHDA